VSAPFAGLPARAQSDLRAIRDAYPRLEQAILKVLDDASLDGPGRARALAQTFAAFERGGGPKLDSFLTHALPVFTREAERLLDGAPRRTVSQAVHDTLRLQLRAQVFGPDRDIQARLAAGIQSGAEGDALKALAYGFQRSDGSLVSIGAAGQARVRTAVNGVQAEAQLARYKASPHVDRVQFVAGGPCKYQGLGGTCTDLDGTVFPIDAIPDWARIPRHPYSNSRWVPYIDISGVDAGGPAAQEPPELT
jgi:hypothetical protein